MKRSRFSLTLIELIISFTLFAILSSFLMLTFTRSAKAKILFKDASTALQKEEHLCFHIQKALDLIKEGDGSLSLIKEGLKIELEGYLDESPYFMDRVSALLFLKEEEIMLEISSKVDSSIKRTLALYNGASNIYWEFLYYTPKEAKAIIATKAKLETIPCALALYITSLEGDSKSFTFFLPPHRTSIEAEGVMP